MIPFLGGWRNILMTDSSYIFCFFLGVSQYSQSLVSCDRMLKFFDLDELDNYVDKTGQSGDLVITVEGVSAAWVLEQHLKSAKTEPILSANLLESALGLKTAKDTKKTDKTGSKYEKIAQSSDSDASPVTGQEENKSIDIEAGISQPVVPINRSIYTLRNISFQVKRGQLVAVVGSVGAGKSSLLSALLGEMLLNSGKVSVTGSIAFCDQRPWILNDTVENNVLFGKDYDEDRFDVALYAANLEDDIAILPGGVNTQIGERGINLSGGQKARVALARAVYADADIYLLDDPLSAVDAHVGQFLFHECICNTLRDKTRILVTHQIHNLPHCDLVVIMEAGEIKAAGSYEELQRSGLDLSLYIKASAADAESATEEETSDTGSEKKQLKDAEGSEASEKRAAYSNKIDRSELDAALSKQKSLRPVWINEAQFALARMKSERRKADTRSTTIIAKEEQATGDVKTDVYLYYVKCGGLLLFTSMVFFILIGQLFTILGSYWLQYWGTVSIRRQMHNNPLTSSDNIYYLNIFAAIAMLSLLSYMLRSIMLANHRLGTSVIMHEGLLSTTLGAPVAFFDTTPVGRILNRFSSDLQTIDEEISQSLSQISNSLASVVGAVGAIAGATKGTFLVLIIPLFYFYNSIQKYYRHANTTVARLESISRSPIYADFSQALNGVNSIRAYNDQQRFINKLEKALDHNSIANITQQLSGNWLAIRLDFMGAIVSLFIALIAVASLSVNFIPAGFLAVGLTYSFQLTTYLKFLVRMVASGEAQMNSVERIRYYMDNINQEGLGTELEASQIPADWPKAGVLEAKNVQLRYRDGPLVLKGIDFDVKTCEKIGIAGRTGSGKSSLMVALFRIQELAGGRIFIDSIDTSTIPLSLLRQKLGIIPQDPVMFSASVRFNLDPFNKHTDEEVWSVLEACGMKEHVLSLPKKLEEDVAEGGDNFSAGQRQLICIARAILRKPRILVLDEVSGPCSPIYLYVAPGVPYTAHLTRVLCCVLMILGDRVD